MAMEAHLKWVIGAILALGIGGYFVYNSTKPLEAELLEVKAQTISQSFKEEGLVTAAVERPVYSVINGKIINIPVKEGQQVNKGDLLVEIESKDLESQLSQLKAQLESINGQEKQAKRTPYVAQEKQQQLMMDETKRQIELEKQNYNRIKTLYDSGAVSKKELDDAQNRVEQLENNLLQQEQALKLIEEQSKPLAGTDQYFNGLKESLTEQIDHLKYLISNNRIVAPISGIVNELPVREGAMVTAQTPLMTLTSNDKLQVEVFLLTEDVISVEEGMPVTLIQKRKNGDLEFPGIVTVIAPAAEEKISALGLTEHKVKVTVAPEANKAPELRPGYALDVKFTTLEQENKIAVPKVVLFPYEDGDALWVVKDGKVMVQKVETGMETDELVVIEKGLQAGDVVIKNPQLEGLKVGKAVE
ncbi:RND family efflux transporter, MFP subunit [Schinkia azotoformans MEV2011]|uniref:RND family efflux transporter, MFP subunit n=1 Tax=Schinkia azotoformans MEV2011 TaxID=1348973 RepID=A0A072NF82_SCHAZ|nr:efflux RND transporter periplasmic adaptor subunit [Schinkia azotoformans]KEF36364.1 RND family efflux transporter, MFP subunit [Schinkia azotoformans MEV2011]MEC1697305.1 efflux RND transporter periplasmic adaptor subunit [Schinkia azotoformans]MEC1724611.1 efflux RND transporter periplasmic adaptor subunit [Schinkia azotoformans]MEC1771822.1 efflux RND transporter periplasmic adaptor subunit [Schinkia azotoformans]MEC1779860.1 efflux RND transporter periplasmic adaptor subunit [Schinkia a